MVFDDSCRSKEVVAKENMNKMNGQVECIRLSDKESGNGGREMLVDMNFSFEEINQEF
jgi:hypothetical protein